MKLIPQEFTELLISGETNFQKIDMEGAIFSEEDITRIRAFSHERNKQINLSNANWRGIKARGIDLPRMVGESMNLSHAYLPGARMYDADLRKVNLQGANLTRAMLIGSDLREANLRSIYADRANLYSAYLKGADVAFAYLVNANLENVALEDILNLKTAFTNGIKVDGETLYDLLIGKKRLNAARKIWSGERFQDRSKKRIERQERYWKSTET